MSSEGFAFELIFALLIKQKRAMVTKSIFLIAMGFVVSASSSAQNNLKMKSINNNAPVKCSKTITINANSEKVWSIMTNINKWATWQTEIKNPKLNGELKPETTFDWKTGGAKIHSTLHTVEPYRQFGWTGKTFGIFAIHNWRLTRIIDIEELATHFLLMFANKTNKKITSISKPYLEALKQHIWKGNIRELKNVIERSVILTDSVELETDSLPIEFQKCNPNDVKEKTLSAFDLASAEKIHIQKVMNYTNGNKTETAKLLNIALTTLYRKLDEYQIK